MRELENEYWDVLEAQRLAKSAKKGARRGSASTAKKQKQPASAAKAQYDPADFNASHQPKIVSPGMGATVTTMASTNQRYERNPQFDTNIRNLPDFNASSSMS